MALFIIYDIATGRVRGTGQFSDQTADEKVAGAGQAVIRLPGTGSAPDPGQLWVKDGAVIDIQQAAQDMVAEALMPEQRSAKIVLLQRELSHLVDYQPSGLERYPATWRDAAAKLDPAALTAEQAARLQAAEDWINGLYAGVYYPTKATIEACTTLAELEAIAWDLSPYEVGSGAPEEDPDVSLAELSN